MKIEVNWLKLEIDLKFNGLAEYARILEDQIERLTNAEKLRLRRTSFPDEVEWQIAWDEHRWTFEHVLPRLLRQSCIVSLFTAIETSLLAICEDLKSRRGLKLSVRELKAEQINRALIYISKVAGIDIQDHSFTDRLKDLGKIRNCVVHVDGRVEDFNEPDNIKRIVEDLKGLSVSHDGYVDFEKGVCYSLIREAHEWVEYLLVSTGLDSKK